MDKAIFMRAMEGLAQCGGVKSIIVTVDAWWQIGGWLDSTGLQTRRDWSEMVVLDVCGIRIEAERETAALTKDAAPAIFGEFMPGNAVAKGTRPIPGVPIQHAEDDAGTGFGIFYQRLSDGTIYVVGEVSPPAGAVPRPGG